MASGCIAGASPCATFAGCGFRCFSFHDADGMVSAASAVQPRWYALRICTGTTTGETGEPAWRPQGRTRGREGRPGRRISCLSVVLPSQKPSRRPGLQTRRRCPRCRPGDPESIRPSPSGSRRWSRPRRPCTGSRPPSVSRRCDPTHGNYTPNAKKPRCTTQGSEMNKITHPARWEIKKITHPARWR